MINFANVTTALIGLNMESVHLAAAFCSEAKLLYSCIIKVPSVHKVF